MQEPMQAVQLFSPIGVYRYVARAAATRTSKLEDRRASGFRFLWWYVLRKQRAPHGALFRSAAPPQVSDVFVGQVPAPRGDQAVDLRRSPRAGLVGHGGRRVLQHRLGDF